MRLINSRWRACQPMAVRDEERGVPVRKVEGDASVWPPHQAVLWQQPKSRGLRQPTLHWAVEVADGVAVLEREPSCAEAVGGAVRQPVALLSQDR